MKRDFKGIWIPKEIWLSKDLNIQEKLFLVEIDSLDNEEGCFATNKYFADFFNLSKNRCSEIIKSLESKNLITVQYVTEEGKKNIQKRVIRVFGKSKGGIRKIEGGYSENCEDNNTYINNTIINNIYTLIFDFWNQQGITKHKQLNDKRKMAIKKVLSEHTEDEIKQCIENYSKIIHSKQYYYSHRFTLEDFLNRSFDKFVDWEVAHNNYIVKDWGKSAETEKKFTHEHSRDSLEEAIRRKTMLSYGEG